MYARLHPRGLELYAVAYTFPVPGYQPDGVMALEAYLDARLPPE